MITVIVPTYNELKNIDALITALREEFRDKDIRDYELLVMDDDSPDGTASFVNGLNDPKIRAVNRRGRTRGLSYAVIDGFSEAKGDIIGVMDADLSHPVAMVPKLIRAVQEGANLAIGSRYVPGGGVRDWPLRRQLSSRIACLLAMPLTRVKDPVSGFFFLRKSILDGVEINPLGFKINLEIIVKGRHGGKIQEVPFIFSDRQHGESKLSPFVVVCYLKQAAMLVGYRFSHAGTRR